MSDQATTGGRGEIGVESKTEGVQETILYRYWDAEDQLLYVGITQVPGERSVSHRRTSFWWSQVARSTMVRYPTRAAALEAERTAIRTERPLFNGTHNPRVKEATARRHEVTAAWRDRQKRRQFARRQAQRDQEEVERQKRATQGVARCPHGVPWVYYIADEDWHSITDAERDRRRASSHHCDTILRIGDLDSASRGVIEALLAQKKAPAP